jgi:hypothetical protein
MGSDGSLAGSNELPNSTSSTGNIISNWIASQLVYAPPTVGEMARYFFYWLAYREMASYFCPA